MLRASSLGLSILFSVIRIHRRGRTSPVQFVLLKHRNARCSSGTSLLLSDDIHGARNSKGNKVVKKEHGKLAGRNPYALLQPNTSDGIQLSSLTKVLQPEGGHCTSALPSLGQRMSDGLQDQQQRLSNPFVKSRPSSVKEICWRDGRKSSSQKASTSQATVSGADKKHGDVNGEISRNELLRTLETTGCASTAWNAYTTLSNMTPDYCGTRNKPLIPFAHLHRLCRLLSRNKPKTHLQFLRLLSILNAIRDNGGRIHVHEWNVLIDHTARGWRKARLEDWEIALGLYTDMVHGRRPGTGATFEGRVQASENDESHTVKPDIYTYNSIINTAVSSRQPHAVRHAMTLLNASGVPPNRITHLTLLKYYSMSQQMSGVRSTVLRMRERGFELGLDGINACMWAYGQNGRPDIVMSIYRLLRQSLSGEQPEDDVLASKRQLEEEEYIWVSDNVEPDGVSFATVIQVMAYYGDLSTTLSVFMDMLTLLPPQAGTSNPHMAALLTTIFRAIFLGFSRHGVSSLQDGTATPSHLRISNPPGRPRWSLQNLRIMLDIFLNLPGEIKVSRSTLHWIMVAFDVTSGQDDVILRDVWTRLDARFGAGFGMHWIASTNRLARWKKRLFPELSEADREVIRGHTPTRGDDLEEGAFML